MALTAVPKEEPGSSEDRGPREPLERAAFPEHSLGAQTPTWGFVNKKDVQFIDQKIIYNVACFMLEFENEQGFMVF